MADLNVITLVGRVGKKPELKETGGTKLTQFGIANSSWKKVGDKFEEETSWFDVTAFGYLAERIVEKVSKGHRIGVTGRLKQRTWQAEDGSKREKIGIVASQAQFLEKAPKNPESSATPVTDESVPF